LTPGDLFPFAATVGSQPPLTLSIEKLEEAILQVLVGERGPKAIAQEYGLERTELERLTGLYREAGRAAINTTGSSKR